MKRLMEHDEIDRILSREDEILPSSGFAVSVMDAVRREAAAPAPIPFPWKRALPGLVVAGSALLLVLVAGIVAITRLSAASTAAQIPMSWLSQFPPALQRGLGSAVNWILLSLLLTFVSVKVSMRLASGRS